LCQALNNFSPYFVISIILVFPDLRLGNLVTFPARETPGIGTGDISDLKRIYSNETMTTYVLLVRGVTPSGRNKLPMSRFREVLEDAGFTRVRTYIQSGNALVDTELPANRVEEGVRKLIRDRIGPDLVVIVRTGDQLEEALSGNPFTEGYDLSRVFFVSFAVPPEEKMVSELLAMDLTPEKLAFGTNAAYMNIPGAYGRGTLSANFLEKKLGISATMRNFNTMKRLVTMSREVS
jgi:uncharacterized protein (DUF1697 family)